METNPGSGTSVHEIARKIYRINTPVPPTVMPGGFSFNQYLIDDEEPLLFHTGPRKMFPLVREAIESIMPVSRLRWISFSHVEADECGALNELLAVAPEAQPLCGTVAAMVSISDLADREPRAMGDGEVISIGDHQLRWIDTPHLPHGWEAGYLFEEGTGTLLCGDIFTQPGAGRAPIVASDILGPSEAFRQQLDYFAHGPRLSSDLERLAALNPGVLACMHGSAWEGNGAALLRELSTRLTAEV